MFSLFVALLSVVGSVYGHAQWGLEYSGQCTKDSTNPNITYCNSHGYTEQMNAFIDSESGVAFSVAYDQIGAESYWHNEGNFTIPHHPILKGSWEFRDDYGVVFARMYAEGVHSEYRRDTENYWVQTCIYNILNGTGAFSSYGSMGFISESSLGDSNGYFESIVSVVVYGPDSSNTNNQKFKAKMEANYLKYKNKHNLK